MRSEKETLRKMEDQQLVFPRNNAPAHRPVLVKDFWAKMDVTTLEHPPPSPDLRPADFYLFFWAEIGIERVAILWCYWH